MNIQLTDEQLASLISDSKQQLIEATLESVKQGISWHIKNAISEEVTKIVKEYVQKEIAPEITSYLAGDNFKQEILKATIEKSTLVANVVVDALAQTMIKNLGDSYTAKQIFQQMVK